jgi:hypothetical protein
VLQYYSIQEIKCLFGLLYCYGIYLEFEYLIAEFSATVGACLIMLNGAVELAEYIGSDHKTQVHNKQNQIY